MATAFGAAGEVSHQSKTAGYPLPGPLPGRTFTPTFNGNGQYRLPDPETGKLTSYSRASTIAKTLEDTWMLDAWAKRMMLLGLLDDPLLMGRADDILSAKLTKDGLEWGDLTMSHMAREYRTVLNDLTEEAQFAAGSKAAAEFGTAVHAWCEWLDHGLGSIWDVPEMFREWVIQYRRSLAGGGLRTDRYWTERIVLNTQWGIAGTLDRLFWNHHGHLFLGDIKTSRGMDYSWLYFAIQLAIYHGASHVLSIDGTHWEAMPAIDPNTALVAHLPREDPTASKIVPISMVFGHQALHTAMTVRRMRSHADKSAQSVSYGVESMSMEHRRYFAARFATETARSAEELSEIWERYQDIWTDDLTEIGRRSLRSANANASA